MKRFPISALLSVSVLFGTVCTPVLKAFAESSRVHTVLIENFMFNPPIVTAREGDIILFRNSDLVPHTVTAENLIFDSGVINSGGEWSLRVPAQQVISFHCTFHPAMKGEVKSSASSE